jgi:hypothetical protein
LIVVGSHDTIVAAGRRRAKKYLFTSAASSELVTCSDCDFAGCCQSDSHENPATTRQRMMKLRATKLFDARESGSLQREAAGELKGD